MREQMKIIIIIITFPRISRLISIISKMRRAHECQAYLLTFIFFIFLQNPSCYRFKPLPIFFLANIFCSLLLLILNSKPIYIQFSICKNFFIAKKKIWANFAQRKGQLMFVTRGVNECAKRASMSKWQRAIERERELENWVWTLMQSTSVYIVYVLWRGFSAESRNTAPPEQCTEQ